MKFKGYLFVTDMDNTLLCEDHTLSVKNKEAIDYFINNGGYFTVATGRALPAANEFVSKININAPAILHNGAKLYDFKTNETVFEKHISEDRKRAVKIMHEKYPHLGFEIYSGEIAYVYAECHKTKRLIERNYPMVMGVSDEIWNAPWTKLLMIAKKQVLDEFVPIYRQYDNGYAVRSGDEFFDIVSSDASKGKALKELAKMLDIPAKNIIAAGDNMNDIELLENANWSFAVENAEDSAKQVAKFIAPSCNDDAIAWIVNELDKKIK